MEKRRQEIAEQKVYFEEFYLLMINFTPLQYIIIEDYYVVCSNEEILLPRFSRNSEAHASEFLENPGYVFCIVCMNYDLYYFIL